MAKKKAARDEPQEDDGRVAFQVRFDRDLHEQLKRQAQEAGISLNQLIQGVCRVASRHLVQGEPKVLDNDFVEVTPTKRCVFVGRPGTWGCDPEEFERYVEEVGEYPEPRDYGFVLFALDFTDRGAASVPAAQHDPAARRR